MLYDAHTHAFPPHAAARVLAGIEDHYGLRSACLGTPEDLAAREKAAGVERWFVHVAAMIPQQVVAANTWALSIAERFPRAVAFGAAHPGDPGFEAQLDSLERRGVRGLKLHPEYQGFDLADPRLEPLLESARGRFAVMVHVGGDAPPERSPSSPGKLMRLARRFPGLTLIAAHLGGYLHWKWALDELVGSDVFIDTSCAIPFIDDASLAEILRRHPHERILFGSDYPIFDPGREIRRLQERLGLSDAQTERFLSNAGALGL